MAGENNILYLIYIEQLLIYPFMKLPLTIFIFHRFSTTYVTVPISFVLFSKVFVLCLPYRTAYQSNRFMSLTFQLLLTSPWRKCSLCFHWPRKYWHNDTYWGFNFVSLRKYLLRRTQYIVFGSLACLINLKKTPINNR